MRAGCRSNIGNTIAHKTNERRYGGSAKEWGAVLASNDFLKRSTVQDATVHWLGACSAVA